MTTPVYCSHTGSNTSPYETKAKAATTLTAALFDTDAARAARSVQIADQLSQAEADALLGGA